MAVSFHAHSLLFQRRLMREDEFLARHCEFNADWKWLAAPMMPMRRLDDHAAARDGSKRFELIRFLMDAATSRRCVWSSIRFEKVTPHPLRRARPVPPRVGSARVRDRTH
jgi:hypothetical protein